MIVEKISSSINTTFSYQDCQNDKLANINKITVSIFIYYDHDENTARPSLFAEITLMPKLVISCLKLRITREKTIIIICLSQPGHNQNHRYKDIEERGLPVFACSSTTNRNFFHSKKVSNIIIIPIYQNFRLSQFSMIYFIYQVTLNNNRSKQLMNVPMQKD